jgi:predicted HTH domain antitoxin
MSTGELRVTLPFGLSEDEARLLLAVKPYEVGKTSLGQAAKLAGFSKRAFMDVLGRYHVPVFDYAPEELQDEIEL